MKIIRVKAVSSCMGIRRASLVYFPFIENEYDLCKLEHPLNMFKSLKLEGNKMVVNDKLEELSLSEETFFYKTNKVVGLRGEEEERMALGILVMNLCEENTLYFENSCKEGYTFDQWDGEYEYLLGLTYDLELHDKAKANIWYQKAISKKFEFKYINK